MSPHTLARLIGVAILIFIVVIMASSGTYVVQPGFRGVEVTMGKVSPVFKPEGFGLKAPFITSIHPISTRQQTAEDSAKCYSADLQQIQVDLRVLFRIPEGSVVRLFQDYYGEPFESLVAPRVQEALKEVTAMQTAVQIVKNREEIKQKAITAAKLKIGTLLTVEDIVIKNLELSSELGRAIEAKMVAEQQAAQARFTQVQTQVEAETAVIRARGEAEAIKVRGEALRQQPSFLRLQMVERWSGKSPLVVPADPSGGVSLILPLGSADKPAAP